MSRICPLFSGSKANCTYISGTTGGILVDIGCSYKSFLSALEKIGGKLCDIKAVAITHEHSDHIAGLKTFLKNNNVPLIASKQTLNTLADNNYIPINVDVIEADKCDINLFDISIRRFATSHDCLGSSGYSITLPNGSVASICTDTGVLTDDAKKSVLGSNIVLIESNHDVTMLKNGPYPPQLKMRILSDLGHLSNSACADFLPTLLSHGTNRIILGHLSQKNNNPMIAKSTAENALFEIGAKENIDYLLSVAKPDNNEVMSF